MKSCCSHIGDAPLDGCCAQTFGTDSAASSHDMPLEVVVVAKSAAREAGEHEGREGYRGPSVPLTELRTGQAGVVRSIDLDAREASMLRAMGLRVNARVRVCRLGEPCIIELVGGMSANVQSTEGCPRGAACTCRIGLSKPLAKCVMVGVG